jgi:histidine triad (HIT) family protein
VFCAIVAGRAPASIVYRDRATLAFMDVNPVRPGHVLVIPTAHRAQIWELGEAESAAVCRRLPALASALKGAMAADAVTVFSLNGRAAGQTVFHVHVHLVPVHAGDPLLWRRGRRVTFRLVQGRGTRAELEALARRIRARLPTGPARVAARDRGPRSRRRTPPLGRSAPGASLAGEPG